MANTKIGVLWQKKGKEGKEYFSGVIHLLDRDVPIVVFLNNDNTENQPTHTIYRTKNYYPDWVKATKEEEDLF
jgi:uncharacterized protein (DUF736 family)